MAEVTLGRYELERGAIPDVCLVCGAPAEFRQERTFSWQSPDAQLMYGILLSRLLVPTKRMTMKVPLCADHRGYWKNRTLTSLALLVLLMGTLLAPWLLGLPENSLYVALPMAFIWLGIILYLASKQIKVAEITERALRLTKVSPAFVAELENLRQSLPGAKEMDLRLQADGQALLPDDG